MIYGQTNVNITNNTNSVNVPSAATSDFIRIGARCVTEINGQFFFLVEIEIGPEGSEVEQVIVVRISAAQAAILLAQGIRRCLVTDVIPTATPGTTVTLVGGFVVGTNVILVFDVENTIDEFILVRTPLLPVLGTAAEA